MSQHLKGLLITTLGVIILSPDALLIRMVQADSWTILFWRGLLFALGITIVISLIYGKNTLQQFLKTGRMGLLLGGFFGLSTTFFVMAVQNTSIANALVIISTSPVFAALLSWGFLKEKTPIQTWLTMFTIIAAMLVIMFDSYQSGGFWGDLSALMTSVLLAVNFTITRQLKDINMVPAMAVSGLVTAGIAAIVIVSSATIPLYVSVSTVPYLLGMGLVSTLAFSLIMLGPRYMPAAEVSMIMPLETVFGSYLGWLFLGEAPSTYVLVGGAVIIISLMIHSYFSLNSSSRAKN